MPKIGVPDSECEDHPGCAYLLDPDVRAPKSHAPRFCGAARTSKSPYCPHHHAICHLPRGSRAEIVRLREIERLAQAVGGQWARPAAEPPAEFLERLEGFVRLSL